MRRRSLASQIGWAAVLALSGAAGHAADAAVRMTEPRAYGYVIGDVIERRAALHVPPGARLDPASLPRPGRVGPLLALQAAGLRPGNGSQALHLRYQVVGAPEEVTVVTLPTMRLRLDGAGRVVEIPPYRVSVGPLTAAGIAAGPGLPWLQPDRVPAPAPIGGTVARIAALLAASVALLAGAWLALRRGRRAQRPELPFEAAWRALRRLEGTDAAAERAAFEALHRAIDATAGRTVFASDLEPLFCTRPSLRASRAELALFFAWSREAAFGKPQDAGRVAELKALSQRLALLERGGRRR